ncbi:unnamed protein product [Eruca vesicaria subsp. sativa]|uniref:Uncharacterized protein n=1 Tax=Eruca vesicaria subsp. sativa TaxID=29727 RepID=A0ABC8KGM0_ERUVS|nr:unnamed protein product [Eruca vesicaria subsp. sativa]
MKVKSKAELKVLVKENKSLRTTLSELKQEFSRAMKEKLEMEEDLNNNLLKLGAGTVVGAAIIKDRSVLFPEITTPNLTQALFIIIAPVVVSLCYTF